MGEGVVEQIAHALKAGVAVWRADDHGDNAHVAALRRGGQAMPRLRSIAGLAAVAADIAAHQFVGVGHLRLPAAPVFDGIQPNFAEFIVLRVT